MRCCFNFRSMLVADSCSEKHLDLQTTIVRMYVNMIDMKTAAIEGCKAGLVHSNQQQSAAVVELQ